MLLNAGITAKHGVGIMIDDEPDRYGKIVLQGMLNKLEDNLPLSSAMRDCGYFSGYMVSMVEVGEKTGRLADTLQSLAEHYEGQERLTVAVKNAAMYPAIMLAMMVAVVMVLIVQVLPIFNDVFLRMGAQMSPFAKKLMDFGLWFRGAAIFIAALFLVIILTGFVIWYVPQVRRGIYGVFFKKWGEKGIFGRVAVSRFLSSIALSLASGIDIVESVNLAASLNSSAPGKKHMKCITLLRSGKTLAESLSGAEILSARESRILSIGDKSGSADSAMAEIARRNVLAVQDEISNIVGRIEPGLVIFASIIVGIILLSVMLPLMGIMNAL